MSRRAPPSPKTENSSVSATQSIPLNRLAAWKGNVRRSVSDTGLRELAASIAAHGLLQSLVVREGKKGRYDVVAGQRRLLALMALAEEGTLSADHPIPCQVIDSDTDATEISLAENAVREDMHPADEFEAFRKLADAGIPAADIAARFGVTETVVHRRLKLARVAPAIVEAFRQDELSLEQVMAFAVSDDHAAQKRVFKALTRYNADPGTIRRALTEDDIAASDKRVKFVTLKAYEKAGGATRRDLFSEGDDGVFILDSALLDRLAMAKLEKTAKTVFREGWKWVDIVPAFSYAQRQEFRQVRPVPVPLSPEEQERYDGLCKERDELYEAWAQSEAEEEYPEQLEELDDQIATLDDREEIFPPALLEIAGVVVSIGYDGKAEITRGLVRPEDVKTLRSVASKPAGAEAADEPKPSKGLSAALLQNLTAHRSAVLAASLTDRSDIALAALVHSVACQVFDLGRAADTCLQVVAQREWRSQTEGSKAFAHLEARREEWGGVIPGQPDALFAWCLEQDASVLLSLLAFCVASTVDAVRTKHDRVPSARLCHADDLAAALKLDMTAWFTPTAENYFGRIDKALILAALEEAKGTPPAPAHAKLKKADLAALAEREVAGTPWLPEPLRGNG
jgi:ParB family chromosome partitioning protein